MRIAPHPRLVLPLNGQRQATGNIERRLGMNLIWILAVIGIIAIVFFLVRGRSV